MLKQLIKALVSVAPASGFPSLALADGPSTGCFERDYTDAHLTKHRIQIVDRVLPRIRQQQGGAKVADMWVTKQDAKGLTFRTKYLIVGDAEECGGAVDLAEVRGQYVSYRLNRLSDAVCAAEN